MRQAIFSPFAFCLITLTAQAQPADPYDPSDYLKAYTGDKSAATEPSTSTKAVKQSEVYMGGKPYIKFTAAGGSIYVPKVSNLSKEDLEGALCAQPALRTGCDSNHPEKCTDPQGELKEVGHSTLLRAEAPITEDNVAYADLIVRTINQKCDGTSGTPHFLQRGPVA